MTSLPRPETFRIQPEFLNAYTFLLYRYLKTGFEESAPQLAMDLQRELGCAVAALLEYTGGDITPLVCYPEDDAAESVLRGLLGPGECREWILRSRQSEQCEATLIPQELPPRDDSRARPTKGRWDVHIVLLPRLVESEIAPTQSHLFMLVDPCNMMAGTCMKAERDFQSDWIARLIGDWWRAVFSRKRDVDVLSRTSSGLTVQELVQRALDDAGELRMESKGVRLYFAGRGRKEQFQWKTWQPRLPLAGNGDGERRIRRRDAKSLVWLARWIGSHRDLENDRAQLSMRSGQPSVLTWVKRHRADAKGTQVQLDTVRRQAATAFLKGAPKLPLAADDAPEAKELTIRGKSLLAFSVNHWLAADGVFRKHLEGNVLSDVEFCRSLHAMTTAVYYALGLQPPPEDLIHRLMQLVAQHAHNEIGVPHRIDLRAHLLHAARGEPTLHSLKQYYRDHFFHAMEVCFFGHVLLETRLEEDRQLWQLVADCLPISGGEPDARKRKVLRLWYVASLLHDIGYAFDVFKESHDHLAFFRHSVPLCRLCESVSGAVEKLSHDAFFEKIGWPRKAGSGDDHGVVSAMHMQSLLERIGADDPTVKADEYLPAVRAIAVHNLRRHQEKIAFSQDPLAFLLVLCDQVQEWRRPQLATSTAANWMLSTMESGAAGHEDLEGSFKSLRINVQGKGNASGDIDLSLRTSPGGYPCLRLDLEYGPSINQNSGVFHLWLDATLNFQRLVFDGFPCNVVVAYRTPQYEAGNGGSRIPQLHRLRNAVHETHMPFLEDWFPNEKGKDGSVTNGIVTHRLSEAGCTETLELDLRALSHRVLMTRDMSAFWKRLKEWRHFNDDRDFPGDYASVSPE